jgi:hypothetical protein
MGYTALGDRMIVSDKFMASFKTYFNLCEEGQKGNLMHSGWFCSRYSNPGPLKDEAGQADLQRDIWY